MTSLYIWSGWVKRNMVMVRKTSLKTPLFVTVNTAEDCPEGSLKNILLT